MATFTLEFNLDNAAFQDDDGDFDPYDETARILRAVASRVAQTEFKGCVRDINGNRVGAFIIEEK